MNNAAYLFGATSLIGWNLFLHREGREIRPFANPHSRRAKQLGWTPLRLEKKETYAQIFAPEPPPLLIHCGGVCDVDQCEADPAWARSINVEGLSYFLDALSAQTRLVYVSTDHVFGEGGGPFRETDAPSPISEYGRLRVEAEEMILQKRPDALIVRAGLLVGPSFDGKKGPLNWLATRTRNGRPTTVIRNEVRSVYWGRDLARRVWQMAESSLSGVRHIPGATSASRDQLAEFLNSRFSIGASLQVKSRKDLSYPHLGAVPLATTFSDAFSSPLPAVCGTIPGGE